MLLKRFPYYKEQYWYTLKDLFSFSGSPSIPYGYYTQVSAKTGVGNTPDFVNLQYLMSKYGMSATGFLKGFTSYSKTIRASTSYPSITMKFINNQGNLQNLGILIY